MVMRLQRKLVCWQASAGILMADRNFCTTYGSSHVMDIQTSTWRSTTVTLTINSLWITIKKAVVCSIWMSHQSSVIQNGTNQIQITELTNRQSLIATLWYPSTFKLAGSSANTWRNTVTNWPSPKCIDSLVNQVFDEGLTRRKELEGTMLFLLFYSILPFYSLSAYHY